jgi:hypothetical protein
MFILVCFFYFLVLSSIPLPFLLTFTAQSLATKHICYNTLHVLQFVNRWSDSGDFRFEFYAAESHPNLYI